jgi:NAD(P)H-flavin reductase/ferredoxin
MAAGSSREEAPTYKATVSPSGESFALRAGERLLGAARRAGVWLPFECGWGSCGTCKVTVLEGDVELVFPGAPSVNERDVRRKRAVACQVAATSDVVFKPFRVSDVPAPTLATRDDTAELVEVEELGPEIRRFVLRLSRPSEYLEGQYAILEVAPGLRRCYSMAGLAGSDTVCFIAKRYPGGAGSEALFALSPGDAVPIELPYGAMWLRETDRPLVLVAGGTGISPILAVVRRLAASGDQRPVRVFYGAGSPAELVAWGELSALVADLADGVLTGAVVDAGDDWVGTRGFVTDALVHCEELAADGDVYLAGPPPMVDAVLGVLKDRSVGLDRISYDRFG